MKEHALDVDPKIQDHAPGTGQPPDLQILPVDVAHAAAQSRRAQSGPPRRMGRALMRVAGRHCYRLVLAGAMAGLLVLMFLGQQMSAPAWLRQAIASRIEQAVPGYDIAFADMHFVVNQGWRPRVGVSDLRVIDADGAAVLDLSSAEASLAMRPLLRGQISPKKITLSGARATLRRDADGAVALAVGDTGQIEDRAASLPALIDHWEDWLTQDPLAALTSIDLSAVTLRYEDARSGRSWTVDDGRLELTRRGDRLSLLAGFAVLSGRDYASALQASYDSSLSSPAVRFGVEVTDVAAQDLATQVPALGWLAPVRARISGALRGGIDGHGAVLPLSAVLRSEAGVIQPTAAAHPIPFKGAHSYLTYDPSQAKLSFDEVFVDSAWGSGTVDGQAWLSGIETGRLDNMVVQMSVRDLALNPAGVYDTALELAGARADLRLRFDPFELTLGEALIQDGDNPMRFSGAVTATPAGWEYALDARIDRIGADRLLQIWPEVAVKKPRIWASKNVRAGWMSDVDVALRGQPDQREPNVYVDFEFDGAEVQVSPHLPPVTGARGQAMLVDHRLSATLSTGQVMAEDGGAIDVAGTSFIVPDVRAKPGTPGIVRAQATGTPTAVLSLLRRPPLNVLAGSDLPVALAEGRMQASGTLALPMKPRISVSEMSYHAEGQLRDVRSDVLVPGHVVAADVLDVSLTNARVQIAGQGQISGVPGAFTWTQPLGTPGAGSRVDGTVTLSRASVDAFNLGLPPDFLSGQGRGTFGLEIRPNAPPRLSLQSDLQGLTLAVPALGWRKSARGAGQLSLSGQLGARPQIDRLTLSGGGLNAVGRVLTKAGGGLDRVVFDRLRLGQWLDIAGELRGRGPGRTPAVRITGGRFDLAGARFGKSAGGDAPPLSVSLDRFQIAKGLALTNVAGDFTTRGGLDGQFRARMNGGTSLTGAVATGRAGMSVQIRSADAGRLFRDAGVVKQARGGDLTLDLTPSGQPRSFDGVLRVTDTSIHESSGIGAVLNAISLVGMVDQLSGNGIAFAEVDADFHLSPDRLTLHRASAVGPSIGLSLNGVYDFASSMLDLRGGLSPLYVLNGLGSLFTGKGGGLFTINFRLHGPASDPQVSVNPLSLLALGPLNEAMRGAPSSVQKNQIAPDVDATSPPTERRRNGIRPLAGEDR